MSYLLCSNFSKTRLLSFQSLRKKNLEIDERIENIEEFTEKRKEALNCEILVSFNLLEIADTGSYSERSSTVSLEATMPSGSKATGSIKSGLKPPVYQREG